jgi:hypothetical protein
MIIIKSTKNVVNLDFKKEKKQIEKYSLQQQVFGRISSKHSGKYNYTIKEKV